MNSILQTAILVANNLGATTYGYGEVRCGDEGYPEACTASAITASGLPLGTELPIVALSLPTNFRFRGTYWVLLSLDGGKTCKAVLLADKKHMRFRDSKPWDFSPQALELFGIVPNKYWSTSNVTVCRL